MYSVYRRSHLPVCALKVQVQNIPRVKNASVKASLQQSVIKNYRPDLLCFSTNFSLSVWDGKSWLWRFVTLQHFYGMMTTFSASFVGEQCYWSSQWLKINITHRMKLDWEWMLHRQLRKPTKSVELKLVSEKAVHPSVGTSDEARAGGTAVIQRGKSISIDKMYKLCPSVSRLN